MWLVAYIIAAALIAAGIISGKRSRGLKLFFIISGAAVALAATAYSALTLILIGGIA